MYIAGTLNVFHGRAFSSERVINYVSYDKLYGIRQYLDCNGTRTSEIIQLRFVLKNLSPLEIRPLNFLGCFNIVTRETFKVLYSNGNITLFSSLYSGTKLLQFQTL